MTKAEALKQIEKLQMIVESFDHTGFEDDEIFLLSVAEYERCKDNIPMFNCWWWLRSPGTLSIKAAGVGDKGKINLYGRRIDSENVCVRPALRIESNTLPIGSRIIKYEFPWIIIDSDLAIAEVPIAAHRFDNTSKEYSSSEMRQFLKDWLESRRS